MNKHIISYRDRLVEIVEGIREHLRVNSICGDRRLNEHIADLERRIESIEARYGLTRSNGGFDNGNGHKAIAEKCSCIVSEAGEFQSEDARGQRRPTC